MPTIPCMNILSGGMEEVVQKWVRTILKATCWVDNSEARERGTGEGLEWILVDEWLKFVKRMVVSCKVEGILVWLSCGLNQIHNGQACQGHQFSFVFRV